MGAFLTLAVTGLSIASIGSLFFAAIMIGRRMSQRDMDRQRRAYVVTFPAEVDAQQVTRWLRTISGRPHSLLDRFVGVPAMVFEVWADSKGITHRLKLPWSQVEHLIPQLQSKVPGAHVMLEEDPPRHTWKSMQELGERAPSRTLDIPFPDVLAESLLTSMQPLKDAEVMLLQWVLVSVKRERSTAETDTVLSDRFSLKQLVGVNFASRAEIEDRNRKLSEPNFRGVLRMAATAETQPRADHLVTRMRSVLDSTATGSNRFVKLHIGNPVRQRERIRHASGSVAMVPPVTVSASELTGLIGWPIGNPNVAGLPQGRTPHLPPTEAISRVGRVLARSTYPGSERPLAMTPVDACKHVHVVGPIGCLHPDTPIYDPVDRTELTVRQRFERAISFHVYALDGDNIVVASAAPPVAYKPADMVELSNGVSRFVVTPGHRVWNGRDFVEAGSYAALQDGACQLPTIEGDDLSKLHADVQHYQRTGASSQAGRRQACGCGGLQLPQAIEADQASSPSLVGGAAHGCSSSGAGGQERRQARSLVCPAPYLPSSRHCARLVGSNSASGERLPPEHQGTFVQSFGSHAHAALSRPRSYLTDKGRGIAQLSAVSSHDENEHDSVLCPPDDSDCGLSGLQLQHAALSPVRRHHGGQVQVSCRLCECLGSSLHLVSYAHYTTFSVQRASVETYYDFHVPGYENYLACGVFHHNSGKTILLGNMAVQDMQQGHGVVLIESKGDLFHYVLDRVPAVRKKDVIVLDANDADHPVGFNLLQQGTTRAAVDELSALMTGMYQDTGVYTPLLMYHGLHALAAVPGAAVSDLPALLTPQGPEESAWRDELIGNLKNNEIRRWWQEFLNKSRTDQDRMALPLHNRLWQLTTRPEVRNIIGQSRSTFSFEDALANNKIVLVYLSPARIGETSVNILGALLIDALWRARRTVDSERPTFLYMDEFQEFVKLFNKTSEMTAQARSFKLGLVLAHQHLGQLPRELRDTLMTNARTKVAFQTEGDDVRTLAQMFARNVDESYVRNLPNYHVLMKFATDHGVTGPVTGATLPPMKPTGSYEGVRRLSRAQYSRPLAEVEAEMEARRRPSEQPKSKRKPRKFGGTDW